MAPDHCPFHDLDPNSTVRVGGHLSMVWTAGECCETWHGTVHLRDILPRVIREDLQRDRAAAFWARQQGDAA